MKRSLLVVLAIGIIFVCGCHTSSIRHAQTFGADEESTWAAVLSAARTITGGDPESVDSKARTITINWVYDGAASSGQSKVRTLTAMISLNPSDLAPKLGGSTRTTWVRIKTDQSLPLSGPNSGKNLCEKFMRTVQDELDRARAGVKE